MSPRLGLWSPCVCVCVCVCVCARACVSVCLSAEVGVSGLLASFSVSRTQTGHLPPGFLPTSPSVVPTFLSPPSCPHPGCWLWEPTVWAERGARGAQRHPLLTVPLPLWASICQAEKWKDGFWGDPGATSPSPSNSAQL